MPFFELNPLAQMPPGSLETALNTVVDTCVNLSVFDDRYRNAEVGCCACDPAVLL